jgi:nicotinate-nucleotide adenylyltransferase
MKRIAFYGGSFDPLHCGHMTIASELTKLFRLDGFVFVPAFHAPHKRRARPTSAFHRFAMLCLATSEDPAMSVSTIELDLPERPYTIETLSRLNADLPDDQIFFVMGGDSWQEITSWFEWEAVLTAANHIVVTRPGFEIGFTHVTPEIRQRVVDVRGLREIDPAENGPGHHIYVTDAVQLAISATDLRAKIRSGDDAWKSDVPAEVAKYIEKYQIYT